MPVERGLRRGGRSAQEHLQNDCHWNRADSMLVGDHEEIVADVDDVSPIAGKAIGAQVVPAGLAFAKSVAKRPQLELYVADKRHPSLAGTYLAACTSFAALFGKSPVGASYTAGLSADVARALQTAAWEAAQAYARP